MIGAVVSSTTKSPYSTQNPRKNTLVYDPALSQTHYIGINDSTELFERNGNEFLTYIQ